MSDEQKTTAADRREAERQANDAAQRSQVERERASAEKRSAAARTLRADAMTLANRAATTGGLAWGEVAEALEAAASAARALAGEGSRK